MNYKFYITYGNSGYSNNLSHYYMEKIINQKNQTLYFSIKDGINNVHYSEFMDNIIKIIALKPLFYEI